MTSRPSGGPPAADPLDEPIDLGRLLPPDDLSEFLGSFAAMHDCGLAVVDPAGAVLAAVGADASAPISVPITVGGEPVGTLYLDGDPGRAGLARHVAHVLEMLLHQAHARRLAGLVHEATVAHSVNELTAKNRSLEAAVGRLRDADRAKSNFLATMSHELRTPLTSVIGYSEMLLEDLAGPLTPEQRDYLTTILGKADQLLGLITSVLDMSRAEAQPSELAVAPVPLAELCASVCASFEPQAGKRGISLVQAIEPMRALGDRRQIRQVVWNLVSNAVKFAADNTEVVIAVHAGPLVPIGFGTRPDLRIGVHVEVRDRGIGIPRDKLAHIFEPFFQVDSSSTRQYGGSGLGLALAKTYVEAHGGRLWVDSTPGEGSTFVASFPAVAADVWSKP